MMENAKGGDAKAEFELANAFFGGKGVPKDESQMTPEQLSGAHKRLEKWSCTGTPCARRETSRSD
jgi:hypothetical protein